MIAAISENPSSFKVNILFVGQTNQLFRNLCKQSVDSYQTSVSGLYFPFLIDHTLQFCLLLIFVK